MSTPQAIPWRDPGLKRLPYEIILYIVMGLEVDDILSLSLSCHHFRYLVHEEKFCRAIVIAKATYTVEAQDAQRDGSYSRALRRLAKRHDALSHASPYVAGMLGLADSYLYVHGVLCYILEARPRRWLRILDLRGAASVELVISIPDLVNTVMPQASKCRKYRFKVLYHANEITSCLFSFALPATEHWLLIFNAREQQIIETVLLDSTAKLFVRNNQDYLYYGTHSEDGADGHRKWVIAGFDIQNRSWFSSKVHLSNMVGYDIGNNVCFEIIGDYFYGLSNQTAFELEAFDWTSFYYCFRFPLNDPHPRKKQVVKRHYSWRRQHSEGPIDDRWGILSLQRDQASGIINIVESRREWLKGGSASRRTYYTKEACFNDDPSRQADKDSQETAEDDASEEDDLASYSEWVSKTNEDPTVQQRSPHHVHPDESSEASIYTRSQVYLCSYNSCCHTFLDLINDTTGKGSNTQCLRLRTGHRRLKPAEELAITTQPSDGRLAFDDKIRQIYRPNEIYTWPRRKDRLEPYPDLDEVYRLLNPPNHVGYVSATCDERSVVYASGEDSKKLKALIYLSFDPAARLAGMSHKGIKPGLGQLDDGISGAVEGGATCSDVGMGGIAPGKAREATLGGDYEGMGILGNPRSQPSPGVQGGLPTDDQLRQALPRPSKNTGWASVQKAMHHDMRGKYAFTSRPSH